MGNGLLSDSKLDLANGILYSCCIECLQYAFNSSLIIVLMIKLRGTCKLYENSCMFEESSDTFNIWTIFS